MNELLREHVTRVGFDLSLGKSHIAALVWVDWFGAVDEGFDHDTHESRNPGWVDAAHFVAARNGQYAGAWRFFVPGVHGLIMRGLVTHNMPADNRSARRPFRETYQITRAGELVVELLRESGIYQEYLRDLPDGPRVQVEVPKGQEFVAVKGEAS